MAKYSASGSKGAANVKAIIEVLSSATVRRTKWYDLMFACTTTPADAVFTYQVIRTTVSMTGSSVTPAPLDAADAAALSTSEDTCTADGTTATVLLQVPLNHRATFRWVAAPGGELVGPATSGAGLTLQLSAASTNTFTGTVHFEEQ